MQNFADDGSSLSFIDTYTQVLEDNILVRSERIIDENPFPGTLYFQCLTLQELQPRACLVPQTLNPESSTIGLRLSSLGLVFRGQAAGSGRPGMSARVRVWADWPMS